MTRVRRPSLVDQVRNDLLASVRSGKLNEGDKLPNEYELADHFAVSRATVREAIQALIQTGHLTRQRGTGTFVTAPYSRHTLNANVSYTAMIREAGHEPSERVIDTTHRKPDATEGEQLNLAADDRLVEVERIRMGDGRPLIYSRDRIPEHVLGDMAEDMLGSSLYVTLGRAGHHVIRATAHLTPVIATAHLAKLLNVKRGTPLLHIRQLDTDDSGSPVMLSDEWHVADAFDLIVTRREGDA